MSFDLDERLAATLKARAGTDVDPAPIVAFARSHGRHLRRWRRGAAIAGAAGLCAVLIGVASMTTAAWSDRTPSPTSLLLPAAPDAPSAAERPELVGTDPNVVHFTAEGLVAGARYTTWSAGRGVEIVEFHGGATQARFVLARSAATLDGIQQTLSSSGRPQPPLDVRVDDRPATARFDPAPSGGQGLWMVRWQPLDRLWAQLDIYADSYEEATSAAARVRFDAAHRCAVPFRLRALPAGARLLQCSVNMGLDKAGAFVEGSLVAGDESGRWLTVRAQRAPAAAGAASGDLTAGPYRVRRQGSTVLQMSVEPCEVEVFLKGWGSGYTQTDALAVLGGYQPATDIDDAETW